MMPRLAKMQDSRGRHSAHQVAIQKIRAELYSHGFVIIEKWNGEKGHDGFWLANIVSVASDFTKYPLNQNRRHRI